MSRYVRHGGKRVTTGLTGSPVFLTGERGVSRGQRSQHSNNTDCVLPIHQGVETDEVWGGIQEVTGQEIQTQAEATGVRLNPGAASHTYTYTPVLPALGKLRQEDHMFEPSLCYLQRRLDS